MATYNEYLQKIVHQYIESGAEFPATARQIAAWAVRERRWLPHPASLISQCAEDLAEAMREECIVDPQGRRVRAKHAARVEQAVLWGDIRTAPREHMEIAFRQRRNQIVGDCRQLKADVNSFNQNRSSLGPIQMNFDFTNDLLELEALGNLGLLKSSEHQQQPSLRSDAANLMPISSAEPSLLAATRQPNTWEADQMSPWRLEHGVKS